MLHLNKGKGYFTSVLLFIMLSKLPDYMLSTMSNEDITRFNDKVDVKNDKEILNHISALTKACFQFPDNVQDIAAKTIAEMSKFITKEMNFEHDSQKRYVLHYEGKEEYNSSIAIIFQSPKVVDFKAHNYIEIFDVVFELFDEEQSFYYKLTVDLSNKNARLSGLVDQTCSFADNDVSALQGEVFEELYDKIGEEVGYHIDTFKMFFDHLIEILENTKMPSVWRKRLNFLDQSIDRFHGIYRNNNEDLTRSFIKKTSKTEKNLKELTQSLNGKITNVISTSLASCRQYQFMMYGQYGSSTNCIVELYVVDINKTNNILMPTLKGFTIKISVSGNNINGNRTSREYELLVKIFPKLFPTVCEVSSGERLIDLIDDKKFDCICEDGPQNEGSDSKECRDCMVSHSRALITIFEAIMYTMEPINMLQILSEAAELNIEDLHLERRMR